MKLIKVPTQKQLDKGRPPSGFHLERVSDGVVFVRDGWRCKELPEGLLPVQGEYSWNSYKLWVSTGELTAMV